MSRTFRRWYQRQNRKDSSHCSNSFLKYPITNFCSFFFLSSYTKIDYLIKEKKELGHTYNKLQINKILVEILSSEKWYFLFFFFILFCFVIIFFAIIEDGRSFGFWDEWVVNLSDDRCSISLWLMALLLSWENYSSEKERSSNGRGKDAGKKIHISLALFFFLFFFIHLIVDRFSNSIEMQSIFALVVFTCEQRKSVVTSSFSHLFCSISCQMFKEKIKMINKTQNFYVQWTKIWININRFIQTCVSA